LIIGGRLGVALTDGDRVSAEGGVSAGDEVGVLLADGDTDGITVRAREVFFFFRCFGVGVGAGVGKDFSATRSWRGRT